MSQPTVRKRFLILLTSFFILFITSWVEIFLQKKQYLLGDGINRNFFFLLINVHVIVIIVLLYLIIRQSIKLFVDLHRQAPGSIFKKNLLFAFTVFSVIPSSMVFFVAGRLITTSIEMHKPVYWSYLFTFILMTLLILFLSIWCAFYLARGISKPIQDLLTAVSKVRKGDLNVQVQYDSKSDLKKLAHGFNEMTKRLKFAHDQLAIKNKEMLMTLEHIKEAVFFVNKFGRILDYNSASKLLVDNYLGLSRFKNKKINFLGDTVKKVFFELVKKLVSNDKKQITEEITFTIKGETKILLVNLTYINHTLNSSNFKKNETGLLIIIEDLTNIVKINKIKTWQQAARQMAHEIKNPLTPIQLATQRLRRKFKKPLQEDKVFFECTNTILNQVKIIKNLVTHFSEFSKMPTNNNEPLDINKIIKEIACLYELSYPEIEFIKDLQNFIPLIKLDKQKIKRVLVNLLDNSVRELKQKDEKSSGVDLTLARSIKKWIKIKTSFKTGRNLLEILVIDNGPGIPNHVKDKLFMPYVSTQKKNMGLGLAIVHESVSQIGGKINLLKSTQGASFQILLPV